MSEIKEMQSAIEKLQRENAELNGLILATGVILTQLLQANTLRELNPQAGATRIVTNAQKAIEAFRPEEGSASSAIMKDRALAAVKQYEDQLRSVLPT